MLAGFYDFLIQIRSTYIFIDHCFMGLGLFKHIVPNSEVFNTESDEKMMMSLIWWGNSLEILRTITKRPVDTGDAYTDIRHHVTLKTLRNLSITQTCSAKFLSYFKRRRNADMCACRTEICFSKNSLLQKTFYTVILVSLQCIVACRPVANSDREQKGDNSNY
jgi:hypothetical protein